MPAPTTYELSSGWEFKAVPKIPGSEVQDQIIRECEETWLPVASVPTEVHRDLEHSGKVPDSRLDLNELAVRWIADHDWTYRTTFETPPGSKGATVDLVFKGLDTFATVNLNGNQILKSDNMFVEYRVNVNQLLENREDGAGVNTLEVTFESARRRGLELVQEHSEHRFIVHQTELSRGPVRKAQYQWGWDWGPIITTCGPWKPIVLEVYTTRIGDVRVDYGFSAATGSVTAKVHTSFASVEKDLEFELLVEGQVIDKKPVSATGAVDELQHAMLSFGGPGFEAWWPRGYGQQKMYEVTVRCLSHGQQVAQSTKRVGFRKAELIRQADGSGESFYFRINGVDIFVGGSCWIPADNYLTRTEDSRYRAWIELLAEGNQNMIRVWGGGVYEADVFYDACDELGIMVWQDFMFACASYPTWPEYLKSVEIEARQNVCRLRHHPSVIIWTGNNEDYQIVERYNLEYDLDNKDPESWLRTNFPARYIYEHLLPGVVEQEAGTNAVYRPSSPFGNGRSTTLKVDSTVGDIHQWNVWHGDMKLYQRLPEMNGRFVSEFGMEAYPHLETLHSFITDETQRYPGSRIMDFHNKAIGHERRLLTYVGENFRLSYDLPAFAHLTQVMQADAMAWAYKFWRRWWNVPGERKCGGALVWQLNDCWPTISWAIVDYFLVKKPAFYAIKRAMEPHTINVARRLHDWTTRPADSLWHRDTAHVDPTQAESCLSFDVWVANSKPDPKTVEITLRFISIKDGLDLIDPLTTTTTLKPNGTTEVYCDHKVKGKSRRDPSKDFSPDVSDPFVIYASLQVEGIEVSTDTSWPDPIKYLDFSGRGVKVTFQAGSEKTTAEITAERPVKGFVISEKRALRVSDNGFDIMPGISKSVYIEGDHTAEALQWTYVGRDV